MLAKCDGCPDRYTTLQKKRNIFVRSLERDWSWQSLHRSSMRRHWRGGASPPSRKPGLRMNFFESEYSNLLHRDLCWEPIEQVLFEILNSPLQWQWPVR